MPVSMGKRVTVGMAVMVRGSPAWTPNEGLADHSGRPGRWRPSGRRLDSRRGRCRACGRRLGVRAGSRPSTPRSSRTAHCGGLWAAAEPGRLRPALVVVCGPQDGRGRGCSSGRRCACHLGCRPAWRGRKPAYSPRSAQHALYSADRCRAPSRGSWVCPDRTREGPSPGDSTAFAGCGRLSVRRSTAGTGICPCGRADQSKTSGCQCHQSPRWRVRHATGGVFDCRAWAGL